MLYNFSIEMARPPLPWLFLPKRYVVALLCLGHDQVGVLDNQRDVARKIVLACFTLYIGPTSSNNKGYGNVPKRP